MTAPSGAAVLRVLAPAAAPAAALAAVGSLDLLLAARSWSTPVVGLLDEPAHLLTAWLLLTAAGVRRQVLVWALVGSVLIDVDHVPLYAGAEVTTGGGGRPVSHSLLTLLVLLALAAAWRSQRLRLVGLTAGVGLHLVRDVALGPGVPVLWPLLRESVRVPYALYLGLLVLAAVVATWRTLRSSPHGVDHPAG
jgi:inner membrane protein